MFTKFSCQTDTELFDDVNEMAEFDRIYNPILIPSGKEIGFLEPMMEYSLFRIDSLAFQNMENSIVTNDKFKEGISPTAYREKYKMN